MLSVLDELTRHQMGFDSNGNEWYEVSESLLSTQMSFWTPYDIQRISQRLRDLGILLLVSPPYNQSRVLKFAFNQRQHSVTQHQSTTGNQPPNTQRADISPGATLISPQWEPSTEVLASLGQQGIPEHFAREQLPEFIHYWRESGQPQRSWGAKFISYVKRQWAFHTTKLNRDSQATALPRQWAPSDALSQQIAADGIPSTFVQKSLSRFRLYHRTSGTTHTQWDMPFFSWLKEDWEKQETPFIDKKKSTSMAISWQPSQHTLEYLQYSYGIELSFINDCIPEFCHKWIEKNAVHSEWGTIFAKHVIEQWRFVQAGVNSNPEAKPIAKSWQPSADCLSILEVQSGIDRDFIMARVPEFVLYWSNRAQPKHSWDNIFLRNIKHQWAQAHQGTSHEGQQGHTASNRTKDRTVAQQLTDRSWAS